METVRATIFPKDVQRITGRSERYGRKLLSDIRKALKKADHQFITVEEFSGYTGIRVDTVKAYLDA